jgi:hypothetical protein
MGVSVGAPVNGGAVLVVPYPVCPWTEVAAAAVKATIMHPDKIFREFCDTGSSHT